MKRETTLQETRSSQATYLYMSFELAKAEWQVGFSLGLGSEIVVRSCRAGDLERLSRQMVEVCEGFGVEKVAGIRSVYEAGFDAFWLNNALTKLGVENVVVDAASIEVNQRGRRRKTDRLDARKLVRKLIQYHLGDTEVWSVCRVPSRKDEDDRRMERERQRLTQDRTAHSNRLRGLLKARGIDRKVNKKFLEGLETLVTADGTPLGVHEKQELRREFQRWELVGKQIEELAGELQARTEEADSKSAKALKVVQLKGLGLRLAWGLVSELFGWRDFGNRDQVGSYVGYDSAPYDTGQSTGRTQGISKSGNRWVRGIMHSVTINWLRWQPESQLAIWYRTRYGGASKGERRKGRVALARKLLVRLWRWVEFDELPNGAELRTAA